MLAGLHTASLLTFGKPLIQSGIKGIGVGCEKKVYRASLGGFYAPSIPIWKLPFWSKGTESRSH